MNRRQFLTAIGAAIAAPAIGACLPSAIASTGVIDVAGAGLMHTLSGGDVGAAKWILVECSKVITNQGLDFSITFQK